MTPNPSPYVPSTAEVPTPAQREPVTTIFEKSVPGRRAATLPAPDVPDTPLEDLIPQKHLREQPAELPEISEPEIVRHYNRISRRNFDLDTGFYPLGSCTMKHNPRLNERVAALPGHARLHPAQDPRRAQGALELMWNLQGALAEICGLPHVSLQPSAGSHGELAGLLLTRAFHNRARRGAHRGADARHRPRHQSRDRDDGRLRRRQGRDRRAGRGGPRRPAREGLRAHRLPDAHQPEHARIVRREHPRDRRDRPRGGGHPVLRRRQPERDHGPLAARRHGLRHRPRQPAQDVLAAARRRRTGGGPDRRLGPDQAVPAGAPRRSAARARTALRPHTTSTTRRRSRSAACAGSPATSAFSSAPTPTSAASAATASPRRPTRRC